MCNINQVLDILGQEQYLRPRTHNTSSCPIEYYVFFFDLKVTTHFEFSLNGADCQETVLKVA